MRIRECIILAFVMIIIAGCVKSTNNLEDIKLPKNINELGMRLYRYTHDPYFLVGGTISSSDPNAVTLETNPELEVEKVLYEYTDNKNKKDTAYVGIYKPSKNLELVQDQVIKNIVLGGGRIPPVGYNDKIYVWDEEIIKGRKLLRFRNRIENPEKLEYWDSDSPTYYDYQIFPTYVWNDGVFIYVVRINNKENIGTFLTKTGLIK